RPTCTDAMTWAAPRPGEHLVPVLWTAADLATIHAAVAAARDRFAESAAQAGAGATQPDRPTEQAPDGSINVEPTRRGYASPAGVGGVATAESGGEIKRRTGEHRWWTTNPNSKAPTGCMR